jgi:hypothetical protein
MKSARPRPGKARIPAGARRYRANPSVVFGRGEAEGVLIQTTTDWVYTLNRTGVRLWELIRRGLGRRRIEEILCREFAVSRSRLSAEIDRMLARFLSEKLIIHA